MNSKFRVQRGFTLLEVLVALALMGIALLTIVRIFSANLRGITVSEDYVAAAAKAEARMREILDDERLSEKAWSETTDDGYRIDASISDTLKDRTENLKVKLLEIDLTVHWTKGTKDRSMTLKTMKTIERKL